MSDFTGLKINTPNTARRIFSVWFRHFRVYSRYFISNGLPPFLEPLIFLIGIGIGLGQFVKEMDGIPYINFLASAIMIPPAMFTASYECTFGTFIRLEFDKVYDGMLGASINSSDLIIGEILFSGTKGFFFSFAVLVIISAFGLVSYPMALFTPLVGFLTGLMFAGLSLIVTYFVKTINHFNFYFTAFLTPMYFFSGIIFPVSSLPASVRWIGEALPLTHSVRLARAFAVDKFGAGLFLDLAYVVFFIIAFSYLSVILMKKRLIH
jgi:lipooligosaccharide transport system permease protein